MAWERGYYYQVRKVDGRVVRQYVGKGEIGELAARVDAFLRTERQAKAHTRKAEQEQLEAIESDVDRLCERSDHLVRAALRAAGYHQHKRGEWRKRRGPGTDDQ
jgi:hypothetical protein